MIKVGVQLHPQTAVVDRLRAAWRAADELGVDSLWLWDHFFPPLYGDATGPHFEGWTLLAAMAADTARATVGMLVSCVSYRNPNLLADMARTIDHVSGGRMVLGLGAGWARRDYDEYGYEFGTVGSRALALRESIQTISGRLGQLRPAAVGPMPLLIGGVGREITLRTVAASADAWNCSGSPAVFAELDAVLDRRCEEIGRDPAEIERTVALRVDQVPRWQEYVEAGARHLIVMMPDPYDLAPVERLLADAHAG